MSEALNLCTGRVSIVKGDAAEAVTRDLLRAGYGIKVFLNGAEQRSVQTADVDLDLVVRDILTPDGDATFDQATGEYRTETVHGKVTLEIAKIYPEDRAKVKSGIVP